MGRALACYSVFRFLNFSIKQTSRGILEVVQPNDTIFIMDSHIGVETELLGRAWTEW